MNKPILKGAIRVGQAGASVAAGSPVPGKPGKYYEAGQFSPNLEQLMSNTISEAGDAGLISTNLPIYNESGEVDKDALDAWNPYDEFYNAGIIVSGKIAKNDVAVFSSIVDRFPKLLSFAGISAIETSEDLNSRAIIGTQLITAITNTQGRKFKATLVTYPSFQQYVTIPVVRAVKKRGSGVSVSTYATFKAIGHVIFAKLAYEGQLELLGRFITASGWSKTPKAGYEKGHFLGKKNLGSYVRESKLALAEITKYSPQDDFAETFAQYLTHRNYLAMLAPEKLQVIEDIDKRYINAL